MLIRISQSNKALLDWSNKKKSKLLFGIYS
uniref:Uncharacterized protein n=1 Tax=Arundo donax TaxID=35708 RepID=A0A0A9FHG0_ARUDO